LAPHKIRARFRAVEGSRTDWAVIVSRPPLDRLSVVYVVPRVDEYQR
jgi:hypothetical protein